MWYSLIRSLLFRLEPERAHHWALKALSYCPKGVWKASPPDPFFAMGLHFPHRVGLAAGLDKDGCYLDGLAKLGFAFIEIGTTTPKPQAGNPKPRLFRLPKDRALINRMGFNNAGVDVLVANVQRADYQGVLGINIGKNKETPLASAVEDYLYCLERVYPHASYVTLNISSPNTPSLRKLQQGEFLNDLLKALNQKQCRLSEQYKRWVPLVVKVSPDESEETLRQIVQASRLHHVEGIIATNTTAQRPIPLDCPEVGGLSGRPLSALSTACLKILKEEAGDSLCLIASGGVDSPEAVLEKTKAGASLFQVYTGLIYEGPGFISCLTSHLLNCRLNCV